MAWPEVVSAVSLAVIAVGLSVCGVAWLRWLGELNRLAQGIERLLGTLDQDAAPALKSVRALAEDAGAVVQRVRTEIDGYADRAQDVRQRVGRLVDDIEDRVQDLETVLDIVQFEVEETALDFAAALKTTRRGATILKAMKRAFVGRGR